MTGTPLPGWPREPSTCFPLGLTLLVNECRDQYSYPWSDPPWAWPLRKSDLPPSPSQHGSLPGQPLPRVPSALFGPAAQTALSVLWNHCAAWTVCAPVGRRHPQPRCREWGAAPTNSSARSRPRRDSGSESTSSDLCQTASSALSPAGPRPPRDPYCPSSSCFTPLQKPPCSRGTAFRAVPRAARGIPRLRPAH